MSSQFRPMLAWNKPWDIEDIRYPVFASYKLDGIRAVRYGPEFLSRSLKTIPNRAIQAEFAKLNIPSGWDGELIVGEPNVPLVCNITDSKVMTIKGDADGVRFFVFDNCEATGGFSDRLKTLSDIGERVVLLDQRIIDSPDELRYFEERALHEGYEGVIVRSPDGAYKYGRSTFREQYMLKLKRFADAEATIIGFKELLKNANEAERDERGYAKRSKQSEGLIPMGVLGAFTVRMDSAVFDIGGGFSQGQRAHYWNIRDELLGKVITFKHFKYGALNVPRQGVFLRFRNPLDMDTTRGKP